MDFKFFVPGRIPGLNEIIQAARDEVPGLSSRRRKVYRYTLLKDEWTQTVADIVKANRIPRLKSIYIDFLWLEPNRRRNKDNIAAGKKFVIDGLVRAGVIINDGWSQVSDFSDDFKVHDRRGVIVTVEEV